MKKRLIVLVAGRANVFFPFILFVKISNSKECIVVVELGSSLASWLAGQNVQMVWRVTCGLTPIIKDDCFDLDNSFFFRKLQKPSLVTVLT